MDHIPNIRYPAFEHTETPYIYGEGWGCRYDNGTFMDFPERNGWDTSELCKGNSTWKEKETKKRVCSFLQAWLYFGIMAEMMQIEVDTMEFILKKEGGAIVTTRPLQKYIDIWQDEVDSLSDGQRESRFRDLVDLLSPVTRSYACFRACTSDSVDSLSPLSPEVKLSFLILRDTLYAAALHIFRKGLHLNSWNTSEAIPGYSSAFLTERLHLNGWCRSDIDLFENSFPGTNSVDLYYATLLGERSIIKDHSQCTRVLCTAYNIEEKSYTVRHKSSCAGTCKLLEVDQDVLSKIIEDECTPLIHISLSREAEQDVVLSRASSDTEYIAISHVWWQGLGNPYSCGLPACQIKQLRYWLSSLENSRPKSANIYFWMDTLCVPCDKSLRSTRKAAIQRMASIYENATAVLVLDADLNSHSGQAAAEETLFRISTCSWFRRLWTLQEGVLAQSLLFQFNDGAISIEALMQHQNLQSGQRFSMVSRLRHTGHKPYARIRSFKATSKADRVRDFYMITQFRSTSKEEDEPYCLASLMQLDSDTTKTILSESHIIGKWYAFLLGQKRFPVQVLFLQEPRMPVAPIGWFQQKMLYRVTPEIIDPDSPIAEFDKDGLHIQASGMLFPPLAKHNPEKIRGGFLPDFKFQDTASGARFGVQTFYFLRGSRQTPCPPTWTDLCDHFSIQRLAIILEKWPPLEYQKRNTDRDIRKLASEIVSYGDDLLKITREMEIKDTAIRKDFEELMGRSRAAMEVMMGSSKEREPVRGAVVAVITESNEEIVALFCGTVTAYWAGDDAESWPRKIVDSSDDMFEAEPDNVVQGRFIEGSQKWCIR